MPVLVSMLAVTIDGSMKYHKFNFNHMKRVEVVIYMNELFSGIARKVEPGIPFPVALL